MSKTFCDFQSFELKLFYSQAVCIKIIIKKKSLFLLQGFVLRRILTTKEFMIRKWLKFKSGWGYRK